MDWNEAIRLIRAGEDVEYVLDLKSAADNESFRAFLLKESGPEELAKYDARIRTIDDGTYSARMAWHSISSAQRRLLGHAEKSFAQQDCSNPNRFHVQVWGMTVRFSRATVRNLCDRGLMAWEGGAFTPEALAVITEKGRFVLAYGRYAEAPR